jgi:hypothetical protein
MRLPITASCALILLLALQTGCSSDGGGDSVTLPPLDGDPVAVADLAVTGGAAGQVSLGWTSPALVEKSGGISYELRYTLLAMDQTPAESWAQAPAPASDAGSGLAHAHTVTGLQENQVYIFALRARTTADNWSAFSNRVVATAAPGWDTTPPEAVSGLRFESSTPATVTLSWLPAGGDGSYGQADGYQVRFAAEAFDDQGWQEAQIAQDPMAEDGGRWQTTVTGLQDGQDLHFAVRAFDEAGNWSPLGDLLAVTVGQGRTWYVNVEGTGDFPTIEAAVDQVQPGDEIVVGPGRYSWTNQGTGDRYGLILIARDHTGFTLRSEQGPEATILDAESQGGVIHIQGYNDIVIEGFTITRGNVSGDPDAGEPYAGGGIVSHLGSPLIRDCIIRWNHATEGGGLWLGSTGQPVLENCLIADNTAELGGGVALVNDALLTRIVGCTIRDNYAARAGGGLRAYNVLVEVEDCVFAGNRSADLGGAVSVVSLHGGSYLQGCTLVDNEGVRGSALRIYGNMDLPVRRSLIAFNNGGPAFSAEFQGALTLGCSDVFGHPLGQDYPELFTDEGGNFQADPLLCDLAEPALRDGSPCAPGNHPDSQDCGLIGALPVGCGDPARAMVGTEAVRNR